MPAPPVPNRVRTGAARFASRSDALHDARSGARRGAAWPVPAVARAVVRVRRAAAVAELRDPLLAVWAGEVILLVGVADAGWRVGHALHARAGGRVQVAAVMLHGEPDSVARALTAPMSAAGAVVAVVPAAPSAATRHAIEALRRAVERLAPCRCVWMAHGRGWP